MEVPLNTNHPPEPTSIWLNDHIRYTILAYLPPKDLARLMRTSSFFFNHCANSLYHEINWSRYETLKKKCGRSLDRLSIYCSAVRIVDCERARPLESLDQLEEYKLFPNAIKFQYYSRTKRRYLKDEVYRHRTSNDDSEGPRQYGIRCLQEDYLFLDDLKIINGDCDLPKVIPKYWILEQKLILEILGPTSTVTSTSNLDSDSNLSSSSSYAIKELILGRVKKLLGKSSIYGIMSHHPIPCEIILETLNEIYASRGIEALPEHIELSSIDKFLFPIFELVGSHLKNFGIRSIDLNSTEISIADFILNIGALSKLGVIDLEIVCKRRSPSSDPGWKEDYKLHELFDQDSSHDNQPQNPILRLRSITIYLAYTQHKAVLILSTPDSPSHNKELQFIVNIHRYLRSLLGHSRIYIKAANSEGKLHYDFCRDIRKATRSEEVKLLEMHK